MWMRLFACAAAAIVLAGCDKDATAPEVAEAPAAAAPSAPAASDVDFLASFDVSKATVVSGEIVVAGAETQYDLKRGGLARIAPIRATIAAGDRLEAVVTVNALKPGRSTILLGQACEGVAEQSSKNFALQAGVNELKVSHTFLNPQTCARVLIGATGDEGLSFTMKSAALSKK